MSQNDWLEFKRYRDEEVQAQHPRMKAGTKVARTKKIGKEWQALGDGAQKAQEVVRLRTLRQAQQQPQQQFQQQQQLLQQQQLIQQQQFLQQQQLLLQQSQERQVNPPITRCPSEQRILKKVIEQDSQTTVERKRTIEFLGGDHGLDTDWIGAGSPVGGGHLNSVGVWVHLDDNGYVDDRVIVKETFLSTIVWDSISCWSGDPRSADREPIESGTLKRLKRDNANDRLFVQLRKDRPYISNDELMYRIYFACLPYLDIQFLARQYRAKDDNLPEPFLWCVFESLARASLVMLQGDIDDPVEDWLQIVHRDLKPDNIFLDFPDPERYPAYPQAVVGDFEFALETSPDDPMNPVCYASAGSPDGTPGFIAPENHTWVNEETKKVVDRFKILSPCNVWSMGAIMYKLMEHTPPIRITERYKRPEMIAGNYSHELQELVLNCMNYAPDDRPTPQDLLSEILRRTRGNGDDNAPVGEEELDDWSEGYRQGRPTSIDGSNDLYGLTDFPVRLGMTRQEVDHRREEELRDLSARLFEEDSD